MGILNICMHTKKSAMFGPIWPDLTPFYPVWLCFAPFGPVWLCFAPFGPVWPCLAMFGPAWSHLVPLGPAWPNLTLLDHFSFSISRYKVPIRQCESSLCDNFYMMLMSTYNTSEYSRYLLPVSKIQIQIVTCCSCLSLAVK